ncbi:probable isoaspartyl peptidase/L-asparaginase 3 isoform X2 [Malania oleifera]|uniref:probable isoaspartyl peptidase/L-asparaginase 3 isoform X2 n=1 Tax=Malania oleifera TaxID=397392 RepID=UPI0025ADC386|nr:probable isoaspartyl peptidase/L-asparaginase 3 isoform X2 [Malania oleifera]
MAAGCQSITLLFLLALFSLALGHEVPYPLVVSTWPFLEAVRAAWRAVDSGSSAMDAVVAGCSACEELRCDGTVGPGGSPDENGETTIDAMVMNGVTMEVGAVAAMRYVKDGIRAAKLVMDHTKHTLLVGEQASAFAISMGLPGPTNLSSPESIEKWIKWKENHCQPNFWKNVAPVDSCGPYHSKETLSFSEDICSKPILMRTIESRSSHVDLHNHDTISMAVIDKMGHIAVGTSTNGATFKIPGSNESLFKDIKGMPPRYNESTTISTMNIPSLSDVKKIKDYVDIPYNQPTITISYNSYPMILDKMKWQS